MGVKENKYEMVLKYVEDNNYEIVGEIRESYIDGVWNKMSENEWLTEIQVPVRKNIKQKTSILLDFLSKQNEVFLLYAQTSII